jgi:hypothetical protein
MQQTKPSPSSDHALKQRWLLPSILAMAVVLHVGFYLFIHDMPLVFSGASGPKFEDKRLSKTGLDEQEIAKKNAQLAHVFRKVILEASGGDSSSTALDFKSGDFAPPDLESMPTEWARVGLDLSLPKNWESSQEITRTEILEAPPAIDIVIASDKAMTRDLLQATEALLGDVEVLTTSTFDPSGVRGGRIELASAEGNALENRSGLRLGGLIDTDYSAYPNLTGGQDSDSFEKALKDHAQNEQHALTGQLAEGVPQTHGIGKGKEGDGRQALSGPQSPGHIASSSDFDLRVEYASRQEGGGYLFRLVLSPKTGVVFKTIKHNVFFLIDRSHSIDKDRYAATKIAVSHALDLLREGDTFNLFVFDNQIVSFSPENIPVTKGYINAAKEWLARQPYGGLFASTDLYTSLGNIVPDAVGPQELNTAILLSDGETYLPKDKQRQCIAAWTERNAGKVALYSLAVGKGNNLPLLDLLTALNRGRLAYSSAHAQVAQSLGDLMKSVENPIGKDIIGSIVPLQNDSIVSLYPPRERLPDLYRDTPYALYGCCSSLEDFYLFLQGRYYDRFLDIKQRVSFRMAQQVPRADLERMWAIQQAYDHYQQYLADGNASSLTAAKRLLAPYGIPLAFQ